MQTLAWQSVLAEQQSEFQNVKQAAHSNSMSMNGDEFSILAEYLSEASNSGINNSKQAIETASNLSSGGVIVIT